MKLTSLTLLPSQWEEMRQQAAEEAPLEACGLLAGNDGQVARVLPMRNAARSAVRFLLDPRQQLDAFQMLDEQGLELIGIYHSHPAGPPTPSSTDVAEAAYPVVNVIIAPAQGVWLARGFWIEAPAVEEIPLMVSK
jgi:proteasome lid subunit RPN8/RPN11